jgi:membrane associated rhomboid family serine protease
MNELANLAAYLQKSIHDSIGFVMILATLLIIMLYLNIGSQFRLSIFGITPRHFLGLIGIPFAPFLHASFNHLFFNFIPFLVLSLMLIPQGFAFYWQLVWLLIFLSGFGIWLFGRKGIHIGASALVTALWGFLVMDMLYNPSILSVINGIICIYYFFGIFLGIFPNEDRVSWEGHLIGLITGAGLYWLSVKIQALGLLVFSQGVLIHCPFTNF